MDETWTLQDLVAEAATRLEALPAPKNGQVRAVPDDRTIRYYTSIGLLDRPAATRGRTALYGRRHLAQVVAIKRMQGAGKSLAEIQTLWPTLDDVTLARMTGVQLPARPRAARKEFWKRDATAPDNAETVASVPPAQMSATRKPPQVGHVVPTAPHGPEIYPSAPHGPHVFPHPQRPHVFTAPPQPVIASPPPNAQPPSEARVELRVEIAPGAFVTVDVSDGMSLTPADVRALRAAAAPLVTELANRGLIAPAVGTLEGP